MCLAWLRSTFIRVLKFLQTREGGSNFFREANLQKVWIICSLLLYFNFKSFVDLNSLSFIRFQCILYDSGVFFSEFWNFSKLKRGDLIFECNLFRRKSELFGQPFCSFFLKVLLTQILGHSLDFNSFWMIQDNFSQNPEISTN